MRNYETAANSSNISVEHFLDSPEKLRETLAKCDGLKFVPYESGLFPASDLSPESREATGMGMAWFRDNAHVAWALYEAGETQLAVRAGRAMLVSLANNRDILDEAAVLETPVRRLPVRVEGDTLANDTEPRVQNDSVGYALWLTSRLINEGALNPDSQDLETLAGVVNYLDKVEYWHDEDESHWEEDRRVHASSIGVVIAGLRESKKMFHEARYKEPTRIDAMLANGQAALDNMLSQGVTSFTKSKGFEQADEAKAYPDFISPDALVRSFFEKFSIQRREHDAALLFLVEPLRVVEGTRAEEIVRATERALRRPHGFARYAGDTYWEPRFTHILHIDERTTQAEGRIEKRNQTTQGVAYTQTEAQWTLFDPVLSTYWGRRYLESGDPADQAKQLGYLQRSLDQFISIGSERLQLPEAYYYEYDEAHGKSSWIPNDHIPLLWSQANLLHALKLFEQTTRPNVSL